VTWCSGLMETLEECSLSVALMFLNNMGKSALLCAHNQQTSFQAEIHPSYPLEHVAEHTGKKSADYVHTKEQTPAHVRRDGAQR